MSGLLLVFLSSLGVGCDTAPSSPGDATVNVPIERREHSDPGPKNAYASGVRRAIKHPSIQVEINASTTTKDGVYLRIPVPPSDAGQVIPELRDALLIVDAPVYGAAVPAEGGIMEGHPWIYVRFPAGIQRPEKFAIDVQIPASLTRLGGTIRLVVTTPTRLRQRAGIDERFFTAASRWFGRRSGTFAGFSGGRLLQMNRRGQSDSRGQSAFAIMAPFESLDAVEQRQFDRGIGKRSHMTVNESTQGETPRSIILAGTRRTKHVAEPLRPLNKIAARVPSDAFVVVGSSLEAGLSSFKEARRWFASLTPVLNRDFAALDGLKRTFDTFNLRALLTAQSAGNVTSFILASRTPSLGSSGDLTVLITVEDTSQLRQAVEKWGKGATSEGELSRVGSRFFGLRDDVLIIGNRAETVRDTLGKPQRTLNADPIFWYHVQRAATKGVIRPILFGGFGAITRYFGPEVRALEGRQRLAQSELLAIQHSQNLFKWLNGTPKASLTARLKEGVLTKRDLVHEDGRGPIDVDTPARSQWGTLHSLIQPVEPPQLNANERLGYTRFREGWRDLVKHGLRPFSVELYTDDTGGRAVFTVTGLGKRGSLGQALAAVGTVKSPQFVMDDGIIAHVALPESATLRPYLASALRTLVGRRDIDLSWAGDWAALGVFNRASLWDTVEDVVGIPSRTVQLPVDYVNLRKQAVRNVPAFAILPITRPAAFERFRRLLEAAVSEAFDGALSWFRQEPYQDAQFIRISETLSESKSRLGLTLAFSDRHLVVAANRTVAELVWNRLKDGALTSPRDLTGRVALNFGAAKWLRQSLAGFYFGAAFPRILHNMSAVDPHRDDVDQERASIYGHQHEPKFPVLPTVGTPFGDLINSLSSLTLNLGEVPEERALFLEMLWTTQPRSEVGGSTP
jgi:hypothetical protein